MVSKTIIFRGVIAICTVLSCIWCVALWNFGLRAVFWTLTPVLVTLLCLLHPRLLGKFLDVLYRICLLNKLPRDTSFNAKRVRVISLQPGFGQITLRHTTTIKGQRCRCSVTIDNLYIRKGSVTPVEAVFESVSVEVSPIVSKSISLLNPIQNRNLGTSGGQNDPKSYSDNKPEVLPEEPKYSQNEDTWLNVLKGFILRVVSVQLCDVHLLYPKMGSIQLECVSLHADTVATLSLPKLVIDLSNLRVVQSYIDIDKHASQSPYIDYDRQNTGRDNLVNIKSGRFAFELSTLIQRQKKTFENNELLKKYRKITIINKFEVNLQGLNVQLPSLKAGADFYFEGDLSPDSKVDEQFKSDFITIFKMTKMRIDEYLSENSNSSINHRVAKIDSIWLTVCIGLEDAAAIASASLQWKGIQLFCGNSKLAVELHGSGVNATWQRLRRLSWQKKFNGENGVPNTTLPSTSSIQCTGLELKVVNIDSKISGETGANTENEKFGLRQLLSRLIKIKTLGINVEFEGRRVREISTQVSGVRLTASTGAMRALKRAIDGLRQGIPLRQGGAFAQMRFGPRRMLDASRRRNDKYTQDKKLHRKTSGYKDQRNSREKSRQGIYVPAIIRQMSVGFGMRDLSLYICDDLVSENSPDTDPVCFRVALQSMRLRMEPEIETSKLKVPLEETTASIGGTKSRSNFQDDGNSIDTNRVYGSTANCLKIRAMLLIGSLEQRVLSLRSRVRRLESPVSTQRLVHLGKIEVDCSIPMARMQHKIQRSSHLETMNNEPHLSETKLRRLSIKHREHLPGIRHYGRLDSWEDSSDTTVMSNDDDSWKNETDFGAEEHVCFIFFQFRIYFSYEILYLTNFSFFLKYFSKIHAQVKAQAERHVRSIIENAPILSPSMSSPGGTDANSIIADDSSCVDSVNENDSDKTPSVSISVSGVEVIFQPGPFLAWVSGSRAVAIATMDLRQKMKDVSPSKLNSSLESKIVNDETHTYVNQRNIVETKMKFPVNLSLEVVAIVVDAALTGKTGVGISIKTISAYIVPPSSLISEEESWASFNSVKYEDMVTGDVANDDYEYASASLKIETVDVRASSQSSKKPPLYIDSASFGVKIFSPLTSRHNHNEKIRRVFANGKLDNLTILLARDGNISPVLQDAILVYKALKKVLKQNIPRKKKRKIEVCLCSKLECDTLKVVFEGPEVHGPPLMDVNVKKIAITLIKDVRHSKISLHNMIENLDEASETPAVENFSLLEGGEMTLFAEQFDMNILDFSLPFIEIRKLAIEGTIILADIQPVVFPLGMHSKYIDFPLYGLVESGASGARNVRVLVSFASPKIFHSCRLKVSSFGLLAGIALDTPLDALSECVDRLLPISRDPSPKVRPWDKIRYMFHGHILFEFGDFRYHFLYGDPSVDPQGLCLHGDDVKGYVARGAAISCQASKLRLTVAPSGFSPELLGNTPSGCDGFTIVQLTSIKLKFDISYLCASGSDGMLINESREHWIHYNVQKFGIISNGSTFSEPDNGDNAKENRFDLGDAPFDVWERYRTMRCEMSLKATCNGSADLCWQWMPWIGRWYVKFDEISIPWKDRKIVKIGQLISKFYFDLTVRQPRLLWRLTDTDNEQVGIDIDTWGIKFTYLNFEKRNFFPANLEPLWVLGDLTSNLVNVRGRFEGCADEALGIDGLHFMYKAASDIPSKEAHLCSEDSDKKNVEDLMTSQNLNKIERKAKLGHISDRRSRNAPGGLLSSKSMQDLLKRAANHEDKHCCPDHGHEDELRNDLEWIHSKESGSNIELLAHLEVNASLHSAVSLQSGLSNISFIVPDWAMSPERDEYNPQKARVVKKGWLFKKGVGLIGSRWKYRWCVLDSNDILSWYINDTETESKGSLDVSGYELRNDSENNLSFELYHPYDTEKRVLQLKSDTISIKEQWVSCIKCSLVESLRTPKSEKKTFFSNNDPTFKMYDKETLANTNSNADLIIFTVSHLRLLYELEVRDQLALLINSIRQFQFDCEVEARREERQNDQLANSEIREAAEVQEWVHTWRWKHEAELDKDRRYSDKMIADMQLEFSPEFVRRHSSFARKELVKDLNIDNWETPALVKSVFNKLDTKSVIPDVATTAFPSISIDDEDEEHGEDKFYEDQVDNVVADEYSEEENSKMYDIYKTQTPSPSHQRMKSVGSRTSMRSVSIAPDGTEYLGPAMRRLLYTRKLSGGGDISNENTRKRTFSYRTSGIKSSVDFGQSPPLTVDKKKPSGDIRWEKAPRNFVVRLDNTQVHFRCKSSNSLMVLAAASARCEGRTLGTKQELRQIDSSKRRSSVRFHKDFTSSQSLDPAAHYRPDDDADSDEGNDGVEDEIEGIIPLQKEIRGGLFKVDAYVVPADIDPDKRVHWLKTGPSSPHSKSKGMTHQFVAPLLLDQVMNDFEISVSYRFWSPPSSRGSAAICIDLPSITLAVDSKQFMHTTSIITNIILAPPQQNDATRQRQLAKSDMIEREKQRQRFESIASVERDLEIPEISCAVYAKDLQGESAMYIFIKLHPGYHTDHDLEYRSEECKDDTQKLKKKRNFAFLENSYWGLSDVCLRAREIALEYANVRKTSRAEESGFLKVRLLKEFTESEIDKDSKFLKELEKQLRLYEKDNKVYKKDLNNENPNEVVPDNDSTSLKSDKANDLTVVSSNETKTIETPTGSDIKKTRTFKRRNAQSINIIEKKNLGRVVCYDAQGETFTVISKNDWPPLLAIHEAGMEISDINAIVQSPNLELFIFCGELILRVFPDGLGQRVCCISECEVWEGMLCERFFEGVDAASGDATDLYLFKGKEFVRCGWAKGATNPHNLRAPPLECPLSLVTSAWSRRSGIMVLSNETHLVEYNPALKRCSHPEPKYHNLLLRKLGLFYMDGFRDSDADCIAISKNSESSKKKKKSDEITFSGFSVQTVKDAETTLVKSVHTNSPSKNNSLNESPKKDVDENGNNPRSMTYRVWVGEIHWSLLSLTTKQSFLTMEIKDAITTVRFFRDSSSKSEGSMMSLDVTNPQANTSAQSKEFANPSLVLGWGDDLSIPEKVTGLKKVTSMMSNASSYLQFRTKTIEKATTQQNTKLKGIQERSTSDIRFVPGRMTMHLDDKRKMMNHMLVVRVEVAANEDVDHLEISAFPMRENPPPLTIQLTKELMDEIWLYFFPALYVEDGRRQDDMELNLVGSHRRFNSNQGDSAFGSSYSVDILGVENNTNMSKGLSADPLGLGSTRKYGYAAGGDPVGHRLGLLSTGKHKKKNKKKWWPWSGKKKSKAKKKLYSMDSDVNTLEGGNFNPNRRDLLVTNPKVDELKVFTGVRNSLNFHSNPGIVFSPKARERLNKQNPTVSNTELNTINDKRWSESVGTPKHFAPYIDTFHRRPSVNINKASRSSDTSKICFNTVGGHHSLDEISKNQTQNDEMVLLHSSTPVHKSLRNTRTINQSRRPKRKAEIENESSDHGKKIRFSYVRIGQFSIKLSCRGWIINLDDAPLEMKAKNYHRGDFPKPILWPHLFTMLGEHYKHVVLTKAPSLLTRIIRTREINAPSSKNSIGNKVVQEKRKKEGSSNSVDSPDEKHLIL